MPRSCFLAAMVAHTTRILIALLMGALTTAVGAQHDDHHNFPPSVMHFHELMAPLGHAAPGPERTHNVCRNAQQLSERALAVVRAPVPDGVSASDWSHAADKLSKSARSVHEACTHDRFTDTLIGDVYRTFHELVRLVGHHR